MNLILQIGFWLLVLLGTYSLLVYPLVLLLSPARASDPARLRGWPSMSIIITVRNEEKRIRDKLRNVLSLEDYPGDVEVIVASDASDDATDDICREFAEQGVVLVRNPKHDGKEAAQELAIKSAIGEILVFSDVATSMKDDVLKRIALHFSDAAVGAISSKDRFLDNVNGQSGEGAYVRYEMWLRQLESRVHSLVGLSGSFFAVRAEICRKHWSSDVPSDFIAAINCIREGQFAILANDVVGYYPDLSDPKREYQRKVRTALRGMQTIANVPEILSFRKYGFFALQLWSHKILRWLAPWCLGGALIVNVFLLDSGNLYRMTFAGQLLVYGMALVGFGMPSARSTKVVRIPYYFVSASLAVMQAAIWFAKGRKVVKWQPSER
jgi:glycosyltransferase involved in cell wall biosynthesis